MLAVLFSICSASVPTLLLSSVSLTVPLSFFMCFCLAEFFSIERNSLAGSESALKLSSTFSVADSVSHSDVLSVLSTTVSETMSSRYMKTLKMLI